MAQIIQIKRGLKANLPLLLAGEMAFCTDTKEIYVGDGESNHLVGKVMFGTLTARPSPGVEGRIYYVTSGAEKDALFVDTGTQWVKVNVTNLDEVADGTTYGKVRQTELTNGYVTQLHDGTNKITVVDVLDRFELLGGEITTHVSDTVRHITADERTTWNAKETPTGAQAKVDAHANKKDNPHSVTKAQVGLGNVDNIKQATKSEFDTHATNKSNPHSVTKAQVGLGNVDNVKQATKAEFDTHKNDSSIHRKLDDTQKTTLNLWSASKISSEIYNAIRGLEWQDSVKNKTTITPPTTNTKGDRYIIPANATGVWSGKTNQIAHWNGSAWEYYTPAVGWSVYVDDENKNYVYSTEKKWVRSGEANQAVVAGKGLTGGGQADEITLNVGAGNGITVTDSGVAVKPANGITVNSSGVGVKAGSGINVDANGVGVKAGAGIKADASGVAVKHDSTLVSSNGTLGVAYGPGLRLDGNDLLAVEVDMDSIHINPYDAGARGKLYVAKVDGGTF